MTGVNVFERAEWNFNRAVAAGRRRSNAFDHVWRAQERYGEVLGGRLAAAIAYYGFFAVFALALIGYAVFGFVLRDKDVRDAVVEFLNQSIPWLDIDRVRAAVEGIQASGGPIGIVGIVALGVAGIGWIEAIRSSQRAFYRVNQQPGDPITRRLLDIAVLILVFLGMSISVAAVDLLKSLLRWLSGGGSDWLTWVSGFLAIPVNMVLAVALLGAVPRLRISPRRLLVPVIVVALGFTLLNTLGRYYIQRLDNNPAYAVVATAVGLLVYLYLFNQVLLWGAALAATDVRGNVIDLAAEPTPQQQEDTYLLRLAEQNGESSDSEDR
jgi:membrane protein